MILFLAILALIAVLLTAAAILFFVGLLPPKHLPGDHRD